MKRKDIILGAGIAGLGAWYADKNLDIYEASGKAGGLCGGFNIDGFHFDNAVHLSFTQDEFVRGIFSKTKHHVHHPQPLSWYYGKWLKHPAQNNLYPLEPEEKVQAVKSFLAREQDMEPRNFKEWNRSRYGDYLWKHMFEPYNTKYWCVDMEQLGIGWIGNRLYQPSIDEVLYGSYTDKTPNTYYAPEMRYPATGGYCAFLQPLISEAGQKGKIHYGMEAVGIDTDEKKVVFADGSVQYYRKLFSSAPLTQMCQITAAMPRYLAESADKLECTGVVLVSCGLRQCNRNQMWFYIYDTDIMAARAYMPSVKSSSNAPQGCASIQFEIYFNKKSVPPKEGECKKNCMYALEKLGICALHDVVFMDLRVLPYGNAIFKDGTEEVAQQIKGWLHSKDIVPIGRFARWEYLWSDQAFLSGYREVLRRKGNRGING